jgi:hypothetical protein
MKTIAKLYHRYEESLMPHHKDSHKEDPRMINGFQKTPYSMLYFYGKNDRIWSSQFMNENKEKGTNPITFLLENDFEPFCEDTWILKGEFDNLTEF